MDQLFLEATSHDANTTSSSGAALQEAARCDIPTSSSRVTPMDQLFLEATSHDANTTSSSGAALQEAARCDIPTSSSRVAPSHDASTTSSSGAALQEAATCDIPSSSGTRATTLKEYLLELAATSSSEDTRFAEALLDLVKDTAVASGQTPVDYLNALVEHVVRENPSTSGAAAMDKSLMEAATSGDAALVKHLALRDPSVLLGTTPHGNTCLHISSMYGHQDFCTEVVELNACLLSIENRDGETPLLTSTTSSHATLASFFLQCCRDLGLTETILKQDIQGYNALHHAIRGGHRELALELIEVEPALSRALNKYHESPMFLAVMRNYEEIFEKLLEIPGSEAEGAHGFSALHAAVRSGNPAIARRIMETRPWLARKLDKGGCSPVLFAVKWNKVDVLKVLLECDRSLGYEINTEGFCLLDHAAFRGNISVAQELLKHCPDAPYGNPVALTKLTCLHHAVLKGREDFVEFILESPQLRKLLNMRSSDGKTALHYAIEKCNPRMVRALLRHKDDIDVTVLDNKGLHPAWLLFFSPDYAKTINWNEVSMLMSKANPEEETNLHNFAKEWVTLKSRAEIKSLTQTYTSNTSLVAILIATVTFAAAFTLPGGYSSDEGSEGLPIMGRKLAFKAFLISDTLAMCSSLSVAFICIIARSEDLEFLVYYRSFTKKLMWFAYASTTIAFATGLYTILVPHLLWLAIAVCILTALLPIITKLVGEWPILKLRFRLGKAFKSELLDMV